jgi:DNA (cytosine-5)-methyltransferase 1
MKKGLDMSKNKKLKVIELFAGVGGFKLGLEGWNGLSASSNYTEKLETNYSVVWSNQWEPSTKIQHASDIYAKRFGEENHSNEDIAKVEINDIPEHDMLVGGFPCQDYSVAKQLSKSQGIEGKKGVLWWQIHRILEAKLPSYIFLENVDRLIKSPVSQRGRDFAIILASLSDLGYVVEWRVINAADYGMPQRRRRVFIFGYHKNSDAFKKIGTPIDWVSNEGVLANAFEIGNIDSMVFPFNIEGDLVEVTKNFNKKGGGKGAFGNTGIMINREVWTFDSKPNYDGHFKCLNDIIIDSEIVPKEYIINMESLEKWEYLKGSKKEERKKSNGEIFYYNEGPMSFPDPLEKPARTIITSEGGPTPSRFKHVINQNGKLRRLTPIELERANMFPDNHTESANDTKRAFFMGNALVVGVIEKVGIALSEILKK